MTDRKKLEAMLMHLLHSKPGGSGKTWGAITVAGYVRFTRDDVEAELCHVREPQHWWEFWKA